MSLTTIPDALDYLRDLFTGLGLDGVRVVVGQPTGPVRNEVVTVGWVPGDDAVTVETVPEGLTNERYSEAYTINGTVSSVRGSTNLDVPRAKAFELLDQLSAAVAGDATLGGLVLRAVLAPVAVGLNQTVDGAECVIPYIVRVRGYTRPLHG